MYKIHKIEEPKNPIKIDFRRGNLGINKSYYIIEQFITTKTIAKSFKCCNY